ncbi:MAG: CXXX repeat peptide maturase [Prevotellaceae bacterium]|nr:CXXX repeat peptide maturase [Prevotellaceae bacterium]
MLQYLIILLDDTSASYCHYDNNNAIRKLISIEDLKAGIFYAMKENLMIQFVYPNYELPQEYKDVINTIDHSVIVSSLCEDSTVRENADVVVLNDVSTIDCELLDEEISYVFRTSKADLFANHSFVKQILGKVKRLNIVITDVESFCEEDIDKYKAVLSSLSEEIEKLYVEGKSPQLNLLTDRMMLDKMNNCNAGWENITLAPDGKFYVCPAFYYAQRVDGSETSIGEVCEKGYSIGDLNSGLEIKNPQLYQLDHAKLCRNCDAYQCKRCVWLNRKTTCEVNTPSHEQCVIAHLERNASRLLLNNIRKHGSFLPEREEIAEINYLDPFDKQNYDND